MDINIIEILVKQEVPVGVNFWCPLFGSVEYLGFVRDTDNCMRIITRDRSGLLRLFFPDTSWVGTNGEKYRLYPSEEQRDWLKYKYVKTGDKPAKEAGDK